MASPDSIQDFKVKASILLKQFRKGELSVARAAAQKFLQLAEFADLSANELLQKQNRVQHKHALAVIALESKAQTWTELKQQTERKSRLNELRSKFAKSEADQYTVFQPNRNRKFMGFINDWYADYDSARAHLDKAGGFLLPYKTQYFIVQAAYIEALGLDPNDPDWQKINFDWIKPADADAFVRLSQKVEKLQVAM